jgi:hypothetical protein
MSESLKAVTPLGAKIATMEVSIAGKVLRVRRHEAFTYTTVVTPAADSYSKPSIVEVRSKARFAERDEETTFRARLGGYEGRSYRVTDKDTGEQKQLVPVNMFLDLLGE